MILKGYGPSFFIMIFGATIAQSRRHRSPILFTLGFAFLGAVASLLRIWTLHLGMLQVSSQISGESGFMLGMLFSGFAIFLSPVAVLISATLVSGIAARKLL
jgi:hypothetical protein